MNPKRIHGLAIVVLMALPAVARAQSDSDDITAQVTVLADLNVTGITDLNFGSVLANSGQLASSDVGTTATWNVQTALAEPGNFDISFSLPTVLPNPGATHAIPIAFGTQSAVYDDGITPPIVFDPAVGLQTLGASSASVTMGDDVFADTTGDVIINVGDVPGDTYTGVITMTVAIL